ncbi:class I SAM-dependent methyltransferase [Acidovorax sp.]|uniref:class I SAM-dependent methyltransferase n=1 Tax=Acidovorax sp. TaxID=1872122 RepID=UPI0025BE2462|nr:class I SAM-dependent methyltransferase [Acidovorax sp.]
MNVIEHNRQAWDRESREGSPWCTPVGPETTAAARKGAWSVVLTPNKPVPSAWMEGICGKHVLCLASGGGQQAPVLAAAGARVTSFDLSEEQLRKDRAVAERDGLDIACIQGDMSDLSALAAESFDMVFHPVSNVFVPDVSAVWQACYRVLRRKGVLLAGFMNPCLFLFDHDEADHTGNLVVRYPLPYREPDSLTPADRVRWQQSGRAAEFSHSLEAQIGGQISAGFGITGFYEDRWSDEATVFNRFSPVAIATRAIKPGLCGD